MGKYQQDFKKVPIWTGFGPHPDFDVSNWYNRFLFRLHALVVREIRRRAEGAVWISDRTYTWTRKGWKVF